MNFIPFIVIKLILGLFICIGLTLTIFMITQHVKVIGSYVVSVVFVVFPDILLYGLTIRFSVSERTIEKRAQRQESIIFFCFIAKLSILILGKKRPDFYPTNVCL